ncbi:hypothetical protein ACFW04_007877 [Cataglyphis niger]
MALRRDVQNYLCIRDSIDGMVNAILNKIIPLSSLISIPSKVERSIAQLTILTVEGRQQYLNEKSIYESAVNYFKTIENPNSETISEIAIMYGIHVEILIREINKSNRENYYVYDKIIEAEHFSYLQEETLWQFLKQLVDLKQIPCTCRICFLLESSIQAREFGKQWNVNFCRSRPKQVLIEWIRSFEMRYRSEITDLCSKECTLS